LAGPGIVTSGIVLTVFRSLPRCLAHIINLATQAVILVRTKSRYYNSDPADDHLPKDLGAGKCYEIGIVQAICIKVSTVFTVFFCWHLVLTSGYVGTLIVAAEGDLQEHPNL
jgi:hypothetical protein